MFHVRRRPADYVPRKRKKKPNGKWNELDHRFVNRSGDALMIYANDRRYDLQIRGRKITLLIGAESRWQRHYERSWCASSVAT